MLGVGLTDVREDQLTLLPETDSLHGCCDARSLSAVLGTFFRVDGARTYILVSGWLCKAKPSTRHPEHQAIKGKAASPFSLSLRPAQRHTASRSVTSFQPQMSV